MSSLIEKLQNINYESWYKEMAILLQEQGYWIIVHDPYRYRDVENHLVTDIAVALDAKTKPNDDKPTTDNIAAIMGTLTSEDL